MKTKVQDVIDINKKEERKAFLLDNRIAQVTNSAIDLAEKQIKEGTASSQVICYFLKRNYEKEKLEKEKMELENKLLVAKTEALDAQRRSEEMFKEAIAAMKSYSGVEEYYDDEDVVLYDEEV